MEVMADPRVLVEEDDHCDAYCCQEGETKREVNTVAYGLLLLIRCGGAGAETGDAT